MECVPASPMREELAQVFLLLEAGNYIAGIGDKKVGGGDDVSTGVVLEDADANPLVLGEQFEQFKPGEIYIVVLAAGDQHAAQRVVVRLHCPRSASALFDPASGTGDRSRCPFRDRPSCRWAGLNNSCEEMLR